MRNPRRSEDERSEDERSDDVQSDHVQSDDVRPLPSIAAEALATSRLSTHLTDTGGSVPPGHRRLTTTRVLARQDFDAVAEALLRWRMHTGAGLRVEASTERAAIGSFVRLALTPFATGPGLSVSCRVVDVIDEEDRKGFTYATLAGHVESGVQTFTVRRGRTGRHSGRSDSGGGVSGAPLLAEVVSVSAPAHRMLRIAGPLSVWAQRIMAARYCRALDCTTSDD